MIYLENLSLLCIAVCCGVVVEAVQCTVAGRTGLPDELEVKFNPCLWCR